MMGLHNRVLTKAVLIEDPSTNIRRNPMKQKWLVAYTYQGGSGRIFIISKSLELTEQVIIDFEKVITEESKYGITNVFITNVIKLEMISED